MRIGVALVCACANKNGAARRSVPARTSPLTLDLELHDGELFKTNGIDENIATGSLPASAFSSVASGHRLRETLLYAPRVFFESAESWMGGVFPDRVA